MRLPFALLLLGVAACGRSDDPPPQAAPQQGSGDWVVRGRVLGPAGNPLEGARVSFSVSVDFMGSRIGDTTLRPGDVDSLVPPPNSHPEIDELAKQWEQMPEDERMGRFDLQKLMRSLREPVESTTDAAGRYELRFNAKEGFTLALVQEGKAIDLLLRARHSDAATTFLIQKDVSPGKSYEAEDLSLRAGGTLSGTVRDERGAPLAGVPLCLLVRSPGLMGAMMAGNLQDSLPVGRTDRDGKFVLRRVPPGKLALGAGGSRHVFEVRNLELAEGGEKGGVDFQLKEGSTLDGRVLAADKAPLSRTMIMLHVGEPIANFTRLRFTDTEGRFRVEGIPPGQGRLNVTRHGYRTHEHEWTETAPVRLEITLQTPGALTGRAVDAASGAPVQDYDVFTSVNEHETNLVGSTGRGGKDGRFTLEAKSGLLSYLDDGTPIFLTVYARGFAPLTRGPFDWRHGGALDIGLFELRPGVTIQGQVRTASGQPASAGVVAAARPGAELSPFQPDEIDTGRWPMRDHLHRVAVDAAGTFALKDLPPGEYDLLVWHAGHPPHRHARLKAPAEGVEVRLAAGGTVSGRVPKGIEDLRLEIARDGETETIEIAADGTFRYGPLLPGKYALALEKSDFILGTELARGEVLVQAGAESTWNAEIEIAKSVARVDLAGVVLREDGTPAPEFQVVLVAEGATLEEFRTAETDREGRFKFKGIKAGSYHMASFEHVTDIQGGGPVFPLKVGPESGPVTIKLPLRTASAAGVLLKKDGSPRAKELLFARPAGEKNPSLTAGRALTDDAGRFTMKKLAAGSFDLYALGKSLSDQILLTTFTLKEGESRDLGALTER